MKVEGVLLVNIDPPYMGFATGNKTQWKHSSKEELTRLLVDVDVAEAGYRLPRECQVRLPGEFSRDILAEFGLLNGH